MDPSSIRNLTLPGNSTSPPAGSLLDPLNIVTVVFCFLIIVIGVVGNIVVIAVYGVGWIKAKSSGIYLINMAVANLIGTTIIPTELLFELLKYGIRPIGDVGCRFLSFFAIASVSVSSFSLVLVSFDRYIIMRRPTRNAFSPFTMSLTVAVIWLLGASVGVVYLIGNKIRLHLSEIWVCRSFATDEERVIHTLITLSLQVLIPLLIMIIVYIAMAAQIRRNTKQPLLYTGEKSQENIKRDKRAMRLLLLIVGVFFLCHIPVNVFFLFDLFGWKNLTTHVNFRVYITLHMVQMASNCINPIIYFLFSPYLDAVTAGYVSLTSHESFMIE